MLTWKDLFDRAISEESEYLDLQLPGLGYLVRCALPFDHMELRAVVKPESVDDLECTILKPLIVSSLLSLELFEIICVSRTTC